MMYGENIFGGPIQKTKTFDLNFLKNCFFKSKVSFFLNLMWSPQKAYQMKKNVPKSKLWSMTGGLRLHTPWLSVLDIYI